MKNTRNSSNHHHSQLRVLQPHPNMQMLPNTSNPSTSTNNNQSNGNMNYNGNMSYNNPLVVTSPVQRSYSISVPYPSPHQLYVTPNSILPPPRPVNINDNDYYFNNFDSMIQRTQPQPMSLSRQNQQKSQQPQPATLSPNLQLQHNRSQSATISQNFQNPSQSATISQNFQNSPQSTTMSQNFQLQQQNQPQSSSTLTQRNFPLQQQNQPQSSSTLTQNFQLQQQNQQQQSSTLLQNFQLQQQNQLPHPMTLTQSFQLQQHQPLRSATLPQNFQLQQNQLQSTATTTTAAAALSQNLQLQQNQQQHTTTLSRPYQQNLQLQQNRSQSITPPQQHLLPRPLLQQQQQQQQPIRPMEYQVEEPFWIPHIIDHVLRHLVLPLDLPPIHINASQSYQVYQTTFYIAREDIDRIWKPNKYTPSPTIKSTKLPIIYRLMSRKASHINNDHKCDWPEGTNLSIKINNVEMRFFRRNTPDGIDHPIDVGNYLKPGSNQLEIRHCSCSPCLKSLKDHLLSIEVLMLENEERILFRARSQLFSERYGMTTVNRLISNERASNEMIESNDNECVLTVDKVKVSLKCPLSLQRIQEPVKGKNCVHIGCFDLRSYISINRQNQQWNCPECNDKISPDDLRSDEFFKSLLQRFPASVNTVELNSNGEWIALGIDKNDREESKENKLVILDDDDEDDDDDDDDDYVDVPFQTNTTDVMPIIEDFEGDDGGEDDDGWITEEEVVVYEMRRQQ